MGSVVGFVVKLALLCVLVPVAVVAGTNVWVMASTQSAIAPSIEEAAAKVENPPADAIVVLGASVLPDGTPSDILRARLDDAVELYFAGAAERIIVSGDNTDAHYHESSAMMDYVVAQGVPASAVAIDDFGTSTYDSMYRARHEFGCESVVVVTQPYHLPRAVYDAQGVGLRTVGVSEDAGTYDDQLSYDLREIPARTKDFFLALFHAPSGTGEALEAAAEKALDHEIK